MIVVVRDSIVDSCYNELNELTQTKLAFNSIVVVEIRQMLLLHS